MSHLFDATTEALTRGEGHDGPVVGAPCSLCEIPLEADVIAYPVSTVDGWVCWRHVFARYMLGPSRVRPTRSRKPKAEETA